MLKSFGFHQAREGMSHDQYVAHWLGVHAPLAVPLAAMGLLGYATNEVVSSGDDIAIARSAPDFGTGVDGIAQLHVPAADFLPSVAESEEGKALMADGPRFVGQRNGCLATEHVIVRPQRDGRGFKAFVFLSGGNVGALAALAADFPDGFVVSELGPATGSTNIGDMEIPAMDTAIELWAADAAAAQSEAARFVAAAPGTAETVAVVVCRERLIISPSNH